MFSDIKWLLKKAIEDYLHCIESNNILLQKMRIYLETAQKPEGFRLMLHEHINIHGEKQFRGFRKFSIHANNNFGKYHRPRFDCVELAVEQAAGGGNLIYLNILTNSHNQQNYMCQLIAIAGNKNLLRPSNCTDRAFVHVQAIVSAWLYDHCTPFLLVRFFRKIKSRKKAQNAAYHLSLIKLQEQIYLGDYGSFGAALYPVSTITAPALALRCQDNFLIFPLKFFSRSRWIETIFEESPPQQSSDLRTETEYEYKENEDFSDLESWSNISNPDYN